MKTKKNKPKKNKPTPPIEELEVILGAAVYNATAEADEDNPDPLGNVCDLVNDAYATFQLLKKEYEDMKKELESLRMASDTDTSFVERLRRENPGLNDQI